VSAPYDTRSIVRRETLISMAINAVLSLGFFFGFFGLSQAIGLEAFGRDFFPQSFMVALMGCLIPSLLVRRHSGQSAGPVILRAVAIAVIALIVAGGGAYLICHALVPETVAPVAGLLIKVVFGAMLAAATTPIAVGAALRPTTMKAVR
jgi:hypothetical protein